MIYCQIWKDMRGIADIPKLGAIGFVMKIFIKQNLNRYLLGGTNREQREYRKMKCEGYGSIRHDKAKGRRGYKGRDYYSEG